VEEVVVLVGVVVVVVVDKVASFGVVVNRK